MLTPGQAHVLVPNTALMNLPASVTLSDFELAAVKKDVVVYVPRLPEYSGKDHLASITFSVQGMPGPYLKQLAKDRVTMNGADDDVFSHFGWKTTKFQFDWPGLSFPPNGKPLTRRDFAIDIAIRVTRYITDIRRGKHPTPREVRDEMSRKWDIRKVDVSSLRLISVNYYKKVWIPVLALDAVAYDNGGNGVPISFPDTE
ncbi:hypothetical protein BDZ97DRAFT_1941030 [Flammula alnicola]|nr:hypothetical protein BDZ97DRAFT_1941030 [Flammula alnicola]